VKIAGIAKALWLAAAVVIVVSQFAGSASAAPLSHRINLSSDDIAIDGTDIYSSHSSNGQNHNVVKIYRSSFLDKSKVEIARLDGNDYDSIEGMDAGGGQLAISLRSDNFRVDHFETNTKVIRISRDGTQRTVLASGKVGEHGGEGTFVVKNGVGHLNDCGTRVSLMSVSSTGSVVIGATVSDRSSKACGRKADVDHWRYFEQQLNGTVRGIVKLDKKIHFTWRRIGRGSYAASLPDDRALTNVEVQGDRALFDSVSSARYYVRDLVTGQLSGPLRLQIAGKFREKFTFATLAASGSVALNSYAYKKGDRSERTGVFANQPSPSAPIETKHGTPLFYCGDHLLGISFSSGRINELDPATLAVKRFVAKVSPKTTFLSIEFGCTNDYFYGAKLKGDSADLLAFPLN
jgi:hypothetical protein